MTRPDAARPDAQPGSALPQTPKILAGLHILIVEDVPAIRHLVQRLLEGLGCAKVYAAGDIDTAWATTNAFPLDAILLDYDLAGENGLQFARILRRNNSCINHDIPILVLTGHAEESVVDAARASGTDAYLVKPIMPDLLGERIWRAVVARGGPDLSRHHNEVNWKRSIG
jgi:two-component system chemotaxis response regulator CheY